MFRGVNLVRRFSTEVAKPVEQVAPTKKKSCSILSRFRSFTSGALFASAVGMYVITFQLQGLLDEVKSAVHDVAVRQKRIDEKVHALETQLTKQNE